MITKQFYIIYRYNMTLQNFSKQQHSNQNGNLKVNLLMGAHSVFKVFQPAATCLRRCVARCRRPVQRSMVHARYTVGRFNGMDRWDIAAAPAGSATV